MKKSFSTNWADDVEAEEAELGIPATAPADERFVDRPSYATSPPQGRAPIHHHSAPPPPAPSSLPNEPPFKAVLGNIPYDLDEDIVAHFFRDLSIRDIFVIRYRDTGRAKVCFVEFNSQNDLKQALARDGAELLRRPLRIQVADRSSGGGGGSGGGYSRGDGGRPRDAHRNNNNNPRDSGFSRPRDPRSNPPGRWNAARDIPDIDRPPTSPSASERPKLLLKPRSQPTEDGAGTDSAAAGENGGKSNPFGNAKPTDTAAKLLELEIRDKATITGRGANDDGVAPPPPAFKENEKERRGGGGGFSRGGDGGRSRGGNRGGGGGRGRNDRSSKNDSRGGNSSNKSGGGSTTTAPKLVLAKTDDDGPKTKIANPFDLLADE